MTYLEVVSLSMACVSTALCLYLALLLRKSKKAPTPTYDARQLLHHITDGSCVLNIKVIDPGDLLWRSPRT